MVALKMRPKAPDTSAANKPHANANRNAPLAPAGAIRKFPGDEGPLCGFSGGATASKFARRSADVAAPAKVQGRLPNVRRGFF
jgi:hypothetical protein